VTLFALKSQNALKLRIFRSLWLIILMLAGPIFFLLGGLLMLFVQDRLLCICPKMMTLRSLPEIGRRFGGRDHTTVLHAVRKIEALALKDHALSEEIESFKRLLND